MNILTPHEGLTNEKICKEQIELLEKKQNEYRLIGQMTEVSGHTLFKFNTQTRIAGKAKIKVDYSMKFSPERKLVPVKRSEVVVQKDCYYEQALNMKNFIKRLRRRGLIGADEQIKPE